MNYSKQKPAVYCATVVCAAALLAGCAKKTVVGKWTGNSIMPTGQMAAGTLEYKPNGSLMLTAQSPMGPVEGTGTYKIDGDQITQTMTDFKMQGRSVMAMLPPATKAKLSQTETFKVEGETLTLTGKGGEAKTLTRVKE